MALEYTCYQELSPLGNGVIPALIVPALGTFTLNVGAASAASEKFPVRTRYVVVTSSANCRIDIDDAPVAKNGSPKTRKIFADKEYVFRVADTMKIAAIQMEA